MANSDAMYTEIANETLETLKEFGKEFDVQSAGVTNFTTQTVSDGVTRKVWGIVADSNAQELTGMATIQWSAKKTLMLAFNAAPVKGDEILVDGVSFTLDKITAIKPADITVVYLLDIGK
jgi:hypothetical protein